jgi:fatty-acyl-CoA synthase
MAEATLAISFGAVSEEFKSLRIDRQHYYQNKMARLLPSDSDASTPSMILTSCGKIIDGHSVRIVKKDGTDANELEIGEIYFSGPSVTQGYFEKNQTNTQHIRDNWLHTGDLGFFSDGELYISGRVKDVIIINGRNIYPQDIEWELDHLADLRMGNHVAISVNEQDTEALIVICESKKPNLTLKKQIEAICSNSVGVYPHDIIFIRPGTLPKTTSGKVRRSETRYRYLNKLLEETKLAEECA